MDNHEKNILFDLKNSFIESKKYWIIYLVILLLFFFIKFEMNNYTHPKMEIFAFIILAISGIFCISFYLGHNSDEELYKTVFIVILIFGILCAFITPILYTPDEVEHFVRAEMTSNGVVFPDYENGSFLTIQSTLDLIEDSKIHYSNGFDETGFENSTIFLTDADTQPINYTLIKYPSAFAQNPFYGYLAPAIGICIAKLFDLNAIWLMWLGRIFNVILYAGLAAIAIKKTPILKIPMAVIACFPFAIFLGASFSIDSLINGLGLLTVSYFFYLYKSPKNSLEINNIIKFSILVFLIGTCKLTCFALILLILFVPRSNFKEKKYYYFGFLVVILLGIIALLWSKFYANPGFLQSWRYNKWMVHHMNSTQQIDYILNHKREFLVEVLNMPNFIENDLSFNLRRDSIYLLFFGAVCLLYPHEKYETKTKIGALLVCAIIYIGTYITFILSWTKVGHFELLSGVQPRYFYPMMSLIPFIFGFNYMQGDKTRIDNYIIMIIIAFISCLLMGMVISIY